MMNKKIGLGLITCNAVEKFNQSVLTVPQVDCFVIVNDGLPYPNTVYPTNAFVIQHELNCGVGKSKNDALKYLVAQGCDHIFLMEDDVLIKNPEVINKYILASETTGILHFNYALQGPNNFWIPFVKPSFWDKVLNYLGVNSQEISKDSAVAVPHPKAIIAYENGVSISLYPHCVGAFSYYRKSLLENVGFLDEVFVNAWEHVEHTYQIILKGYHPPFWWFADISSSKSDLSNIENVIEASTIRKNPLWIENSILAENHFKFKTGYVVGDIPTVPKKKVASFLDKRALVKIKSKVFYAK